MTAFTGDEIHLVKVKSNNIAKKSFSKAALARKLFNSFKKLFILVYYSLVFTGNFSLAKIICHRNFGNESAFTHSKD